MSCSVFKWGPGWQRGFCYSGASWELGGENIACCICFSSVSLIVVFFSLHHSVKLFSSQPTSFCLSFLLILLPTPPGREKEWESNCMVLCHKLRQNHNMVLLWNSNKKENWLCWNFMGFFLLQAIWITTNRKISGNLFISLLVFPLFWSALSIPVGLRLLKVTYNTVLSFLLSLPK